MRFTLRPLHSSKKLSRRLKLLQCSKALPKSSHHLSNRLFKRLLMMKAIKSQLLTRWVQ